LAHVQKVQGAGALLAPFSLHSSIEVGVAQMPGHRSRANWRRILSGALSAAVILVSAPTASAQLDTISGGAFLPVVKVQFPSLDNLDPAEKRRNEKLNAAIVASPRLAIPAPRFSLPATGADAFASLSALDCMTAAIYYEAANEPITGQRAVAQVVLNRVRHPAYPNTVCGVVFQGSERATGCQFTFTCDGSLARRPSLSLWNRARTIAAASLGGFVETSVGHATHYHASYVLPYWAPKLTKLTSIGSHIFYQWKDSWSHPSAYSARYAGNEAIPLGARSLLNGYLLSGAPDDPASAQLSAAQLSGQTSSVTSIMPVQANAAQGKNADIDAGARPVTNLNVAKSEMIETRARLKDSPQLLAVGQGKLPN
jgi:spore germination cell wall hydrolase CwlJ-like protein